MRNSVSTKRLIAAGVVAGIALAFPYLVSLILRWTVPVGSAVNWSFLLPGILVTAVAVAGLAARILGRPLPRVVSVDLRVVGWSTVVLLAPLATALLLVSIGTRFPVESLLQYTQSVAECSTCGSPTGIALTRYVQVVLLVSVADEVLFRGALYGILRKWMPERPANILQALLGCIYYVWAAPFYFLLGLYLNRILAGPEHVRERILVRLVQGTLTFVLISLSYNSLASEQGGTLALFCISAIITLVYAIDQKSTPWKFARRSTTE